MYGLPRDVDLAFFIGKTLLQVCIGAHDLILNFDGDVSVTVTSAVACRGSNASIEKYSDFREAAYAVAALLNHSVISAEGDDAGTLAITFDGGEVLFIYDDSREYESYTITSDGGLIVV